MAVHSPHCPKLPWMIDFYNTKNKDVPSNQIKAAFAENHLEYMKNLCFQSEPSNKRLTGIMCTIGPKSDQLETLVSMIKRGMTIARIKLPFYNLTDCEKAIKTIRTASDIYSKKMGSMYEIAVAMDLRGPDIRTGTLKNGQVKSIELIQGNETTITTDPQYEEHVTENMIFVDYQKINELVEPGDKFFLDNRVTLSAIEIVGSFIRCIVEKAGRIGDRVSVSLDSTIIDLPTVSEIEIEYAKDLKVDVIMISSVKDAATIREVRRLLADDGKWIQVISKIGCSIGVKNVDEIIKESDGILISRTELANEIPPEKVFLVQKMIIASCNKVGKPVICAPEMLQSMTHSPNPKRGEYADVANTVIDGVDVLMLSRETACGDYVLETVKILDTICKEAEAATYHRERFANLSAKMPPLYEPIEALAVGTVETSQRCGAAAIIVLTTTGRTAKVIAKYRPRCPIIAITRFVRVARQLRLHRGIEPIFYVHKRSTEWRRDVNTRVQFGITYGKYNKFIKAADSFIVVSGCRAGTGFSNGMHVFYASEFDSIDEEGKL